MSTALAILAVGCGSTTQEAPRDTGQTAAPETETASWPPYPGAVELYDQTLDGVGGQRGSIAVSTSSDAPDAVILWFTDELGEAPQLREDGTAVWRRQAAGDGEVGLGVQPLEVARLPEEHPAPDGAATVITTTALFPLTAPTEGA